MNFTEQALVFEAEGEQLVGIVAKPEIPRDCGVLVIVGGPQYRVGSHRQFLHLSRRLAAEGFPVMRFDYRGMGDGGGEMRDFETVSDDVAAAIDVFQSACPAVGRIVLWGLCDAASAALLYVHDRVDARVAGLVLLNPWVRSETSLAQTQIKHYYGDRLMQAEFWIKLLSGKMQVLDSVRGALGAAAKAWRRGHGESQEIRSFQDRMAAGLQEFSGNVLLILSGQDYTAKEFLEYVSSDGAWRGLIAGPRVERIDVSGADHTFSSQQQRSLVEDETLRWCEAL